MVALRHGLAWLVISIVMLCGRYCAGDPAFDLDNVRDLAQKLARETYRDATPPMPKMLEDFDYDAVRNIRWKENFTLWKDKNLPFQIQFSSRAGYLRYKKTFYVVNSAGVVKPFPYSPDYFDFGRKLPEPIPVNTGYGGFSVNYAINDPNHLDGVMVFSDASYFRSFAQGQVYGLSCRGLAINSGIAGITEEFPAFTTFWFVEPAPHADVLTFYALLDGPSVTGAYQFKLRPGAETVADVTATLYFRHAVAHLGIAPLTSMFWYGENSSDHHGDFRPQVHDSSGALVCTSRGEWLWRPLQTFSSLNSYSVEDKNPRGFGLFQRDHDFDHYQDLYANYHLRPSCWVEPLGNWGEGRVSLVQLPISNETIDNIVQYWEPSKSPAPGDKMDISYRLHWFMNDARFPPLARVAATRVGYASRIFPTSRVILDFTGPDLEALGEEDLPHVAVATSAGEPVQSIKIRRNPYAHSLRVIFDVPKPDKVSELRCQLQRADGSPLSETWTYTWTPQE